MQERFKVSVAHTAWYSCSAGVVRQEHGARSQRAAPANSRHRHEPPKVRLSARIGDAQARRLEVKLYRLKGLQQRIDGATEKAHCATTRQATDTDWLPSALEHGCCP